MTSPHRANNCLRIAVVIGALAPAFSLARFAVTDYGDMFYSASLVLGISGLAIALAFGWFLGLKCLLLGARLLHYLFGQGCAIESWNDALYRSVLILPYAAAGGGITWLVYSLGGFGGWPDDVIFGCIANIIGALVYIPLLVRWRMVVRSSAQLTSR